MPAKPKLPDPGALIRGAKLRTEEFRVCVEPDLVAEYETLLERREVALDADRDSLAAGVDPEVESRIDALREQMRETTVTLRLQALPRPRFRALIDKHPQRKDADGKLTHQQDILGFSYEAFFNDLLRISIIEPELDAETLDLLLDERLPDKQWQDLADVAWGLNRSSVDVPFLPAVSPNHRSSSPK